MERPWLSFRFSILATILLCINSRDSEMKFCESEGKEEIGEGGLGL
jgi:hypothetical protein